MLSPQNGFAGQVAVLVPAVDRDHGPSLDAQPATRSATSPSFWRCWRTIRSAVAPSPAAEASCFVLPDRTSPAANTPGLEVCKVSSVTTKPQGFEIERSF